MSHTGEIQIHAVAIDGIHHGAGTSGNTVVLRRQEVPRDDGTVDTVPFVSGNSIRHMLRNAGVLYALEAMGVEFSSLSKGVVDLLFSGGSLGGKNSLTLAKAKRIEELFPILSLLGYSAGSSIRAGRVEVHHLHLVCEENLFRMPDFLRGNPHWDVPAAARVTVEFGTRHDVAGSAAGGRYLEAPKGLIEPRKKGEKNTESLQMIYEFETIAPRSELFGGIVYRGLKDQELDALASALSYACDGADGGGYLFRVGAKSSVGFGRMVWRLHGFTRAITAPSAKPDSALMPAVSDGSQERLLAYQERLRQHKADVLAELEELSA
jgi:hypothetical protein